MTPETMNIECKIWLITTFGRSLLGEITHALRAAAVRVESSVIFVSYFFNEEVTEELVDHYLFADSEVYAAQNNLRKSMHCIDNSTR